MWLYPDDWTSHEDVTWYEHVESVKNMSREFPDIIFTLYGRGENDEDMWNKYFLNGKVQVCNAIITYEPFDESKLIP